MILRVVLFFVLFLFSVTPTRAVILFSTGDPTANTSAPTGVYANSGWQYEGAAPNPSGFYATEIAAHRRFVDSILMQLVSAVSRKTHGNTVTFDVDLPSSGRPGIECR